MRLWIRAGRLAAAVVGLLAAAAAATGATYWLNDNFDAYANGNLCGQGGWTGAAGPVRVQSTFVSGSGGKAIAGNYRVWGPGETTRAVSSGPGGEGHYIDFDAALDTAGDILAGENLGYLKFFGTNGLEVTRFYFAHSQFKVLTSAGQQVVLPSVAPRTWHHIRIGLDLGAGTIDVWVDGFRVITRATVHNRSTGIGSVVFGQWNGLGTKFSTSETYLDNLACQNFPVPGASRLLSPIAPWAGWEHFNVAYPCVLFDSAKGVYTMYYSGSYTCETGDSLWDQWAIGRATSTDGANWKRPVDDYEPVLYARRLLEGELLDPEEISTVFDSVAAFGPCVLQVGAGYRMWYTGWNGESVWDSEGITTKTSFRIGLATSSDGLVWVKHDAESSDGSVLGLGPPGQPDSHGCANPSVLQDGGIYRMWYEGFDGATWRVLCATSPDGVNWTRQGTVIDPGPAGSRDALGARNPVVVLRGGQYEMWYSGISATAPRYRVLRATSPDGVAWSKLVDEIVLHPDSPVSDDERVFVDSVLVDADGSCQAFFAKEITSWESTSFANMRVRQFHIYREVLNP